MEIRVVLKGKFLAANNIYIIISWVSINQDPVNVMVAMLGLTEKMDWLVINWELAKVQIIKHVVHVGKTFTD